MKDKVIRGDSTKKKENHYINIRFSSFAEKQAVEKAARNSGFGTALQSGASSYIKKVVFGYKAPQTFDNEVMIKLIELHAKLARVGNLFKLALDTEESSDWRAHAQDIYRVKKELEDYILEMKENY